MTTTARSPGRRSREPAVAGLLELTGAGLVLLAAGRPWARAVLRQAPLPTVVVAASGRSVAPVAAALGLVGLAGVVAVLATRGAGRLATGVLVALAGAGVMAASVYVALDLPRAVRPTAERISGVRGASADGIRMTVWPRVSVVGGALVCAAGLLTAARGGRWTALSARYDAPGADRPAAPIGPAEIWDALERGEDPTR